MIVLIVLTALIWWAAGLAGYVYWWTTQHDFDTEDLGFAIFIGLILGPLAWGAGWLVHHEPREHKVLIPKRERQ